MIHAQYPTIVLRDDYLRGTPRGKGNFERCTHALPSTFSNDKGMVGTIPCVIYACTLGWQSPPALLILGHASQAHLSHREAAPLSLLSCMGTDAVSIESSGPSKNLLAAGTL